MNQKRNAGNSTLPGIILGIAIGLILFVFIMPFALMMIVWGGDGKWDDEEKIAAVVTENEETFQDIASRLLAPEQDLDFTLDIREKKFRGYGDSRDIEEELFDLEDIYHSAKELKILKIEVYKDSDIDMVIFETYADGMAGSGSESGFLYLKQEWTDDIFEYDNFKGWRKYDHSEIADHWYYYEKII